MTARSKALFAALILGAALATAIPSNAMAESADLPSTPISNDNVKGPNAPKAPGTFTPSSKGTGLVPSAASDEPDVRANYIIGQDLRTRNTNTKGYPSRTVVYISYKRAGTLESCTGFMYDVDMVATAGHCVHLLDEWNTDFVVFPGRNGALDIPFGSCKAIKAYTVLGWSEDMNTDYDYGALKLDCAIGETTGWYGLQARTDSLNGVDVVHRGYPGDKQPPMTHWFVPDKIRGSEPREFRYTFATAYGQSGGPIYINGCGTAAASYCAIGLHSHESPDSAPSKYNAGTRIIPEVFDNYVAWMK